MYVTRFALFTTIPTSVLVPLLLYAALMAVAFAIRAYRKKRFEQKMDALLGGLAWVPVNEFLRTARTGSRLSRKPRNGERTYSPTREFTGCYILHNVTKDKYYVGQAKRVVGRVKAHLAGRGNGDLYADYKYGDAFEVRTISLALSGYSSLNGLERDLIKRYNAYTKGYNRTRGNQG